MRIKKPSAAKPAKQTKSPAKSGVGMEIRGFRVGKATGKKTLVSAKTRTYSLTSTRGKIK